MDVEEIKSVVVGLQKAHDTAIAEGKASTAEHNLKIEKMAGMIADFMKKSEDEKAKLESEIEVLKAMKSNTGSNQKQKSDLEIQFGNFLRNDSEKATFYQHCKKNGLFEKGMNTGSLVDGGFLVLPEFEGLISTRVYETTPMRRLATIKQTSQASVTSRTKTGRLSTGGWVAEQDSRTATNGQQYASMEIFTHEQYAMPEVTTQDLQDAFINLESDIGSEIGEVFAEWENNAFVNGNGVNKPRGFLTYDNWTTPKTWEFGKIEQIKSGSNGAVTSDGIIDLITALKGDYQSRSVFLMNTSLFASLCKLKYNDNRYIFNVDNNNPALAGTIFGKQVIFAPDMPDATTGSKSIAYGDFRAAYKIVDRVGLDILRDPFSKKGWVQFYATKRVGGSVINFEAIKIQTLSA